MSQEASRLAAMIDGALVPDAEARALWKEFSEHMDEHRGDMAGFARKKGWFSIAPEHRQGKAVLLVQTSASAPKPPPPPPPKLVLPRPPSRAKPQGKGKMTQRAKGSSGAKPAPKVPGTKPGGGGPKGPPGKKSR
jgi:hypothetical protein